MALVKFSLKFWWITFCVAIENSLVGRQDLGLVRFDVFDRNLDLTCREAKKASDIAWLPTKLVIVQNIEDVDPRALDSGCTSNLDDLCFSHEFGPRLRSGHADSRMTESTLL